MQDKPNSLCQRRRIYDGLMSIARFAEGFPDYTPTSPKGKTPSPADSVSLFSSDVVEFFGGIVQLIMSVLEVLKTEQMIREAVSRISI
jgi:hypothetical protein